MVARMAFKMAMESRMVRADVIEAMEFITLSQRYGVQGVPRIIINETTSFEGAIPEPGFLTLVLKAAGEISDDEFAKAMERFHHHH
jgi:predicted DsbA family dithiol-disulfide isomerase